MSARRDAAVSIVPVQTARDLTRFIRLPWQLYRHDRAWVPPLRGELKKLLSPGRHPFHRHADVRYFLARAGGEVVGRVAAVVNHEHVRFHDEPVGFFGFFECTDDQAAATALLAAAEAWLVQRGMHRVRGPMNFSTNEECGLLIDGFETPPAVMMPHHLPYYARLLQAAGYAKGTDLLAYLFDIRADPTPPTRLVRSVERLKDKQGVTIRPIDLRRFDAEVRIMHDIYHRAWQDNWGFVPMTEPEVDLLAKTLRRVADPRLCLMAEMDGRPVGFAVALPDYNQTLRHLNGRLFPFGLLKFLWYRRRIDKMRILLLGTRPDTRLRGVDAMLYLRFWHAAAAFGYPLVECSWIVEDNWAMRRGLERMGARIHKTYRVYEKAL